MSTKRTLTAAAVLIACGLLAPLSASAAPAGWMVNGTLLSGVAAMQSKAVVDVPFLITAAGETVRCKGINNKDFTISSPSMALAEFLEFTECGVITGTTCLLKGTVIKTVPLLIEATLDGTLASKATAAPETKELIAEPEFEGEMCAFKGKQPLRGKFSLLAPEGQDERTFQLISAVTSSASGELKLGTSAASLTGTILQGLESDKPWSHL